LEAAQQEFHRSLLGVIEADNQTTTDTEWDYKFIHSERRA